MTCSPSSKDPWQANFVVPHGGVCPSLLERGTEHMTWIGEEDCNYLFSISWISLVRLSPGKARLEAAAWFADHTGVTNPMTMSQTHCGLPVSKFRSVWRRQSTLPLLCSSVSWWGTQRTQHFHTPEWIRRFQFKFPNERLKLLFLSLSVIRGSSLWTVDHDWEWTQKQFDDLWKHCCKDFP